MLYGGIDYVIVTTDQGRCYHEPLYKGTGLKQYLVSRCGLDSRWINLYIITREKAMDSPIGFRPCKRCYREKYCELCGEKTILLRKCIIDTKVYRACEVCWSELP